MAISQYSSDGRWEGPLAANVNAVVGDLACIVLSSGYLTPGAVATGLKTIGTFATAAVNNPGSAGAKRVQVNHGHQCRVFRLANAALRRLALQLGARPQAKTITAAPFSRQYFSVGSAATRSTYGSWHAGC